MANSVDYRSSLFWVHAVLFHTKLVSSVRQLFAADNFSRRHFQMHFLLGPLQANVPNVLQQVTPVLGVVCVVLIVLVVKEPVRGAADGGTHLHNTAFFTDLKELVKK